MCARAYSLGRHPQSLFARPPAKERERAHHSNAAPRETIAPQKDGIVKLKEESAAGMR
jgi:hypothetical protein